MDKKISIDESLINKSFRDLVKHDILESKYRYLCVFGGAGSGKSYAVGFAQLLKTFFAHNNLLVVRNTARSNRDSTFALLKQIINSAYLKDSQGKKVPMSHFFKVNSGDLRITNIFTKNEIIFSGLDDVEKLKSVTFANGELTSIWVEEASEILEKDFNQLDVRLRGGTSKKQIVLTFNPIDVNHWLKKRFIDRQEDNIKVHHTTYLDNEFLDDDYKRLLESYKDTDPYYYNVYCLGEWGVLGNTIFDAEKISTRISVLEEPMMCGSFTYDYDSLTIKNVRFIEDKKGYIKIFKKPQPNVQYCIGGDTAGEGSDYFIGQVLDENGNQVAVLRQQMDADLYTKQMYCLGQYYNNALLTIEVNFDTYPIKELERLGYTNMFVREMQDTFSGQIKKAHGFRTDSLSRPRIISQLVEIVREYTDKFNDKTTLEEMLTFVRNEKGRAEAQLGAHDDLVMAIAIAYEGIKQLKPILIEDFDIDEEDIYFDYGNL